jgi:sterol desaturase/sphingolipid hydroxylase (fatty acid hydroxylase superfamily)
MEDLSAYWSWWSFNDFLVWGVGPFLCFIIGFAPTALFFEWLIMQPFASKYLINQEKSKSRTEALQETRKKIPFWVQLKSCCWTLFGPTTLFGVGIAAFIMPKLFGKTPSTLPSLYDFTVDLIMMELLGDFFLYWGHRVQHEYPYLWKNFHSLHHTIDTPSPISTLYIDSNDATLQGSLPMILAGMIIRPHPFTFYIYMILRVGENVLNHSGIILPFLFMFPFLGE